MGVIGLLDETGDAITKPGPVGGDFTFKESGVTVVDYKDLE